MNPASILKNIAKHISLNDGEIEYFTSLLRYKSVTKKSLLLSQGGACKYIYFVESGAIRAFHQHDSGKESTIMFAITDWWVTDMNCFINQLPAILNIEAIEDSNVFQLSKNHLDELYTKVPKFERFFRIIMQNAYIREQQRVIHNLSLSAEQRYHIFLNKYPQIVYQITQKQIASYLGITPEFLSTLKTSNS